MVCIWNLLKKVNSFEIIKTADVGGKRSKSDYYKYLKENGFEKLVTGVCATSDTRVDFFYYS